jgi:hypothetical protein
MIKLLNYISNWVGLFFIIWLILKQTKYSKYADYINPYYGIYFIFYGYFVYILLNYLKGVKFDPLYVIFGILTHYAPIYIFNLVNGKHNNYSLKFFIFTIIVYLLFINYTINKNPIDVYIRDKQVTNIKEFFIKIKLLS